MFTMTLSVPWILQLLALLIVLDAGLAVLLGKPPSRMLREAHARRRRLSPTERERLLALENASADRALATAKGELVSEAKAWLDAERVAAERAANSPHDAVYQQRNRLVCVVAQLVLSHAWNPRAAGRFIDPEGEEGFKTVVYFELPDGQVTFHMDERDPARPWQNLPEVTPCWDGHSDEEKWERVLRYLLVQEGQ